MSKIYRGDRGNVLREAVVHTDMSCMILKVVGLIAVTNFWHWNINDTVTRTKHARHE